MKDRTAKEIAKELKLTRKELEKFNKQAVFMGKTTNLTLTEINSALNELKKRSQRSGL